MEFGRILTFLVFWDMGMFAFSGKLLSNRPAPNGLEFWKVNPIDRP